MLTTGGLLACAALLALAAVAPLFHGSNPPRWTTYGWVGEVVTLGIVCTLAIGIGYLGAGTIRAAQAGLNYVDLALLAGVLLVSFAIWRKLTARRWSAARARPAAPAAAPPVTLAAAGTPGGVATGAGAGAPLTPKPSRPTRRAA